MTYQLLADAVLVLHLGVVLFIVAGLVLVLVGNLRGWQWVNRRWFRLAHLGAIVYVVVQAWLGRLCPLTKLEQWLRERAGSATYGGSFVEHWVQRVLYYDAPPWVFTLVYTAFGLLVLVAWRHFPPRPRDR
ncbi:MAG TPA: DUF2784 domain-containing protein [Steroidobacteraceae bacterium]|nr:DUF2784 domain-containing protein [Steroidobacteraceae bacterium]